MRRGQAPALPQLKRIKATHQKVYEIIWRRRRDSKKAAPFSFASQITDCMSVLLRLRRTVAHGRTEFSSLNHTNKSHTSKDVWLLLAQKERLEKGCAFFICFANNRLYVSVLLRLRRTVAHGRIEFESLYKKNNPTHQKVYEIIWRRRRDSNSRTGFPAYALSRGASSPT